MLPSTWSPRRCKLASFAVLYRFRIFHPGYQWWVWGLVFFADEFSYYWFHHASHERRLFWASHVVHHSSQHYNLSTALRQSWAGTFSWGGFSGCGCRWSDSIR
jgi:sterol desaturase/sphingolipid hydroxylase (fatty acid hydroxylase superfamily)